MSFAFEHPVDPRKPLDRSDPPPEDWVFMDAHEHSKALFGYASNEFRACVEWQEREKARHAERSTVVCGGADSG